MKVAGVGVVSLRLQDIHLHTKSRIRDRDFVLLRHVQLELLLEPHASVPLTKDLELGPACCELLRETQLRRDGGRHSGLLVLGAGRRRGSNLSPLVCLVEAVKLRKDEGARASVFGGEEEGGGVRGGPGAARTILLFHIISVRPSKQPSMVGSTLGVHLSEQCTCSCGRRESPCRTFCSSI
jgi:hypothetical protein